MNPVSRTKWAPLLLMSLLAMTTTTLVQSQEQLMHLRAANGREPQRTRGTRKTQEEPSGNVSRRAWVKSSPPEEKVGEGEAITTETALPDSKITEGDKDTDSFWDEFVAQSHDDGISMATTVPTKAPSPSRPSVAPAATGPQTIWDIIQTTPSLETLKTAVEVADLVETLDTADPLTVFAPTNLAFEFLGSDYVSLLTMDPAFGLHLQSLLLNHVTDTAAFSTSDLTDGLVLNMAGLESIQVDVTSNATFLNTVAALQLNASSVRLNRQNEEASNGILHRVPGVLSPAWAYLDLNGVMDVLQNRFSVLQELLVLAGMEDLVNARFNTLIGPSNEAFQALPRSTRRYLKSNPEALREVLSYHFATSVVNLVTYPVGDSTIESVQGDDIVLTRTESDNGEQITLTFNDIPSRIFYFSKYNILYEIDQVMFPPGFEIPNNNNTTTV